ncbi:ABC transporter substrate-binding protein [Patescibacteria group bacterium]
MKKPSIFLRVVKSYTKHEKIISVVLIALVVIFGAKIVTDKVYFSGGSPAKEGIYTEGFENIMFRINPVFADLNEPDRDVSSLIFKGLTKYDPETKKIVGDMADITISENQLTYRFKIKDNIKFHDGEILDADDVMYTFQTVIQSEDFQNPILRSNFEGVEIEKVDFKTVEFKLTAPNSFFITNTTVGVLPSHLLSEVPIYDLFNHEFNFTPVGTGPYMVSQPLSTSLTGVTQIVLERFDGFYEELPQLQKIRFFGYPTRAELIENRSTLNAIPKVMNEAIDEISQDSRFSMYGYSLPQYFAVFINMDNPTLKSLKVRQALQKSIYKDAFLDILPNTIRVETPVLSLDQDDYKYIANLGDAKELLYDAGFKKYTVSEEGDETDVEEEEITSVEADDDEEVIEDSAATEEVGTVNEEVIRKNVAGQVLEFRLIARLYPEGSYKYEEMNTVLGYLEEKWGEAGVKLNIELYDAATLQEKIAARDYDLLIFGQSLGYNLDLYGYWHSTQTGENGANLSNYKSFAVDTLIEAIRESFDDEEKQAKLQRLAEIIQEDIPAIFLYRPVYYYASDNKVQGINLDNLAFPADRFCRVDEWYF